MDSFRQSLAISRETGYREGEGRTLLNLGRLLLVSDKEQARVYLELSLHIQRDLKDPQYEKRLAEFNRQFPPSND